jgi:hypothetical protein
MRSNPPRGLLKRRRLITFNTKITHLSDVPCSSQDYRARLGNIQPVRSGRGYEARSHELMGASLVHPQRGQCVMGYSVRHETTNLCSGTVEKGAQTARSRAALQRCRMVSPLIRLWVRPFSKLAWAAISKVHRLLSLPKFLGLWCNICLRASALSSSKAL